MGNKIQRSIDYIIHHVDDSVARLVAATLLDTQQASNLADAVEKTPEHATQILSSLKASRQGLTGLYFQWMAENLEKIRSELSSIPTENVILLRKGRKSTKGIFEDKISKAERHIENTTSGLFAATNGFFEEAGKHDNYSPDTIHLIQEIQKKSKILQRQLRILKSPYRRFVANRKVPLVILIVAIISGLGVLLFQQYIETGGIVITKILEQLRTILSSQSAKTSTLGSIYTFVSTIPAFLTGVAIILGLIRRWLLREHWKHPALKAAHKRLASASAAIREELGGSSLA